MLAPAEGEVYKGQFCRDRGKWIPANDVIQGPGICHCADDATHGSSDSMNPRDRMWNLRLHDKAGRMDDNQVGNSSYIRNPKPTC